MKVTINPNGDAVEAKKKLMYQDYIKSYEYIISSIRPENGFIYSDIGKIRFQLAELGRKLKVLPMYKQDSDYLFCVYQMNQEKLYAS